MTCYDLALLCLISVLTLWIVWLWMEVMADRSDRKELLSELQYAVNRCTTAENQCTASEAGIKAVEANVAKLAHNVQGWHDCLKPASQTVDADATQAYTVWPPPAVNPKQDGTIDFELRGMIDPEGRTGEMTYQEKPNE